MKNATQSNETAGTVSKFSRPRCRKVPSSSARSSVSCPRPRVAWRGASSAWTASQKRPCPFQAAKAGASRSKATSSTRPRRHHRPGSFPLPVAHQRDRSTAEPEPSHLDVLLTRERVVAHPRPLLHFLQAPVGFDACQRDVGQTKAVQQLGRSIPILASADDQPPAAPHPLTQRPHLRRAGRRQELMDEIATR